MRKLDLGCVVELAKPLCKGFAYGALLSLLTKSFELDVNIGKDEIADYGDAVQAIMDSAMFGSDKSKAVAALKKCASSEYYKAIISIVSDGSMFGSDKVKLIQTLSEG